MLPRDRRIVVFQIVIGTEELSTFILYKLSINALFIINRFYKLYLTFQGHLFLGLYIPPDFTLKKLTAYPQCPLMYFLCFPQQLETNSLSWKLWFY